MLCPEKLSGGVLLSRNGSAHGRSLASQPCPTGTVLGRGALAGTAQRSLPSLGSPGLPRVGVTGRRLASTGVPTGRTGHRRHIPGCPCARRGSRCGHVPSRWCWARSSTWLLGGSVPGWVWGGPTAPTAPAALAAPTALAALAALPTRPAAPTQLLLMTPPYIAMATGTGGQRDGVQGFPCSRRLSWGQSTQCCPSNVGESFPCPSWLVPALERNGGAHCEPPFQEQCSPHSRDNCIHTPWMPVRTLGTAVPTLSHSARWALLDVPTHRPYLVFRGWGWGLPLCPKSTLLPSCCAVPDGAGCSFPAWDSPTAPPQPYQQHLCPGSDIDRTL